jgi:hypothetical protein
LRPSSVVRLGATDDVAGKIDHVVTNTAFQTLSREISELLARTPKREVYEVL